ncbi:MAG: fasciclin domain-containing protein [Marinirhabdus sp.]
MKFKNSILPVFAAAMIFMSCDDGKKKAAEMQAEKEKMELEEVKIKAEEEAKILEMKKMEIKESSIVSKAAANPNYSTLVQVLKSAGLAETFMEEGEYTVFAPSNMAFSKVPITTMEILMKVNNKEKLQNLLKYHVVKGKWKAEAVVKAITDNDNAYNITTMAGDNLVLSVKDGKVMVKDAKGNMATVTDADMGASNGVMHGIDKVLMPEM